MEDLVLLLHRAGDQTAYRIVGNQLHPEIVAQAIDAVSGALRRITTPLTIEQILVPSESRTLFQAVLVGSFQDGGAAIGRVAVRSGDNRAISFCVFDQCMPLAMHNFEKLTLRSFQLIMEPANFLGVDPIVQRLPTGTGSAAHLEGIYECTHHVMGLAATGADMQFLDAGQDTLRKFESTRDAKFWCSMHNSFTELDPLGDPLSPTRIESMAGGSRYELSVVTRLGVIVGTALSIMRGKDIAILALAVARSHRRQNIATFILQSLSNRYLEYEQVTLSVDSRNTSAVNFYQKAGFMPLSVQEIMLASDFGPAFLEHKCADTQS